MKDAIWFLLITLIGIPVGGLILTYVAARLSRTTAKETALLAAKQRRRDIEITQLQDALKDLLEAGTAVQSYTWFVDEDIRLKTTIPKEEFHKHGGLVERAVFGAQRVRAVARAMPTEELRDSYDDVAKLIMEVVSGSDDPNATDAWHADLNVQPDTITRAITATADEIKRLYDTYPTDLPSRDIGPKPDGAGVH